MSSSTFRTLTADAIEGVAVYKDYIKNGRATVNTDGWSTYADAAGSTPVDGTGGSPNVTWTRTTSSPLSGDASFLFTKDAANRQGQGVSYTFTIDSADDNGGLFNSPLSYSPDTGTYSGGSSTTDSDLTVYVVSLEFGTVIQPSYYKLDASVNGKVVKATPVFQLPVSAGGGSARQFRLCVHVATTSASAYTVKFDEIKVNPQPQSNVQYGSFKLPTIQKFTSSSGTYTKPDGVSYIKVKMVGGGGGGGGSGSASQTAGGAGGNTTFGSLTCNGGSGGAVLTGAGGAGGSATLGMGSGIALTGGYGGGTQISNNSESAAGSDGAASPFGGAGGGGTYAQPARAGSTNTGSGGGGGGTNGITGADYSGGGGGAGGYIDCIVQSPSSTYSYAVGAAGSAGAAGTNGNAGAAGGSGVIIVEEFYTPTDIGANSIISMSTDKTTGSHTSSGSWQDVAAWDTPLMDRGGNFNATTGVYTVNEPGDYDVYGTLIFSTNATGIRATRIYYNNTTAYSGGEVIASSSAAVPVAFAKTIPCKSGDTIRIQGFQNSGGSLAYNATYNSLSICKRQTNNINQSEKIAARYTSVTADAIGTSLSTLTYPTKVFDTHNAYSGGFFTAPTQGKYFFKAGVLTNPATLTTGQALAIEVRKNSSTLIDSAQTIGNGASNYYSVQTSGFIDLNAGDTIDVQVKSSVATTVGAASNYNTFEIFRI